VHAAWSLRAAVMQMPLRANGNVFDSSQRDAQGANLEFEWHIPAAETVVRALAYDNEARMGLYSEAIARAGNGVPDIAADDKPGRHKYGWGLNLEQPIADGGETGAFARIGWSDGAAESFVFTESDRLVSGGFQLSGVHWGRGDDRAGIATAIDGIVKAHQDYLARGGNGFLLGDGALTYGAEQVVEGFYRIQLGKYTQLSPDVQYIRNPGYNRDRGPATVVSMRLNVRY
jgi:high affinity Mn2+ porin